MAIIKHLEEPVRYVCQKYPKFSFRIETTRFKFDKGQLLITNPAEVEMLDELLANKPDFAMKIKKVDKAAAEEFARQHRNKEGMLGGAVKGGLDSQKILDSQTPIEARDKALADAVDPKALDALTDELAKDSALVLTQKAENPVESSTTPTKPSPLNIASLVEKK